MLDTRVCYHVVHAAINMPCSTLVTLLLWVHRLLVFTKKHSGLYYNQAWLYTKTVCDTMDNDSRSNFTRVFWSSMTWFKIHQWYANVITKKRITGSEIILFRQSVISLHCKELVFPFGTFCDSWMTVYYYFA